MAELSDLLVKDAAEVRRRGFTLNGGSIGTPTQVCIVGEGKDAVVWIGAKGGHCYGLMNGDSLQALVDMARRAGMSARGEPALPYECPTCGGRYSKERFALECHAENKANDN